MTEAFRRLFGIILLEIFGQPHKVVAEPLVGREAYFDECIRHWITFTAST
jgi:hypothetical protein